MSAEPLSENYPSPNADHRRADLIVHMLGLAFILVSGGLLLGKAYQNVEFSPILALIVYVLCALASNLASNAYHFSPSHDRRSFLRRVDHAAIYPSISGTFTPFFIMANTTWTLTLLFLCWALTALAVWIKMTSAEVKSKWSTASYLGLGALGLCALPDMIGFPAATPWLILGGALAYVIGTLFYARKTMPYRYAIWHSFVTLGGMLMFASIWLALF